MATKTKSNTERNRALIDEAVANGKEVDRIAAICKEHGVPFDPWFVERLEKGAVR